MSMKEKVIALGFFDGVHLGHAALLRRTVEEAAARGVTPAVFTFDRVPKEVITGIPCPLINSPEDRKDLLRRLYGIQEIIMVPFDDEMRTTAWDEFVTEILVKRYHAVHLVAGHDHHFGHKNAGSPELLMEKCTELGLGCDIIPKVEIGETTVSSTYIRRLVELGQVDRANQYLGHPHVLTQEVRHGRRIGHTIGVPTVNLVAPPHVLVPSHGVYATRVTVDGREYGAVTNVGVRPTVDENGGVTVESHLIDVNAQLYGSDCRVEFLRRLRGETKFESLTALQEQIAKDIASAKELLKQ